MIQKNSNSAPIDFEELTNRCKGKTALAKRLVDMFESEIENYLSDLERCLSEDDANSIAASAHTIKGSAATSSANSIADFAGQIENAARQGDVDTARELLPDLANQITRLIEWEFE